MRGFRARQIYLACNRTSGFTHRAQRRNSMVSERTKDFNRRLSQWVAGQGFWFQLRYSMVSGGVRGRAMFHLFRLTFRLVLFILTVSVISGVLLLKRANSRMFSNSVKEELKSGLVATDLAMGGFAYARGQLEIAKLAAEGEDGTFFKSLQIRSLRCKMSLLDGLVGKWNPGAISIAKMDVDLRAGADDEQTAAKLADVLFAPPSHVILNAFGVGKLNLRWGYSERTQGSIEGSTLWAQRSGNDWRLTFKGGKFCQNWLRDLDIVNLVVVCNPKGIWFEDARFSQGNGTVDMTGTRIEGGSRPKVDGLAKIRRLNLESALPPSLLGYVEGTMSGDLRVSGSTNTANGIVFEGQILMDGEDVITLRDKVSLLRAFSVMDFSRNYHRIDLRNGSFDIKTGGGGLVLSAIDLKADQSLWIQGELRARLPTQDEIQRMLQQESLVGISNSEGEGQSGFSIRSDLSLKRAALEEKHAKEIEKNPEKNSLFDRINFNNEIRELELEASERMSRMLQYDGLLRLSLPGDSFERAGDLKTAYPPDPLTQRIHMDVPLSGYLHELTTEQAAVIYSKGRRSK